jgi:hypothetical protein
MMSGLSSPFERWYSQIRCLLELSPQIQIELLRRGRIWRPNEESLINILLKSPPRKCDHCLIPSIISILPYIMPALRLNGLQVRLRQVREEASTENLGRSGRVRRITKLGKVTVLPESVLRELGVLRQRA